ncbi:unnamed protein product, partial [marine sediment metagenome]
YDLDKIHIIVDIKSSETKNNLFASVRLEVENKKGKTQGLKHLKKIPVNSEKWVKVEITDKIPKDAVFMKCIFVLLNGGDLELNDLKLFYQTNAEWNSIK